MLNWHQRLRFSLGGGTQPMSGSHHIDNNRLCFIDFLTESQFLAWYFVGAQLLINSSYHTEFIKLIYGVICMPRLRPGGENLQAGRGWLRQAI
ncbi:hypothetical protein, partial [Shimia ponticola]|uniref:hypothetical protein n=1 Tax=Shimia ponticola TaxID=2582893 RepID=UPI002106FD10